MTMAIQDERTFGVEIEFFLNQNLSFQEAQNKVVAAVRSKGIACYGERYNHTTRSYWKVVSDASVNYEGLEIVSPPLSGQDGLRQIKLVCEALNEVGAKVNKSCGLHIHHDASDADVDFFKGLYYLYFRFENTLDSLMPKSRRGNGNKYCRSVNSMINIHELKRIKTLQGLKDYFHDRSRYVKLNFQSFLRHGTIEFRQHSGTVEFDKIANWVLLTKAMVNRARENRRLVVPNNRTDSWERLMGAIGPHLPAEVRKFYNERRKQLAAKAAHQVA